MPESLVSYYTLVTDTGVLAAGDPITFHHSADESGGRNWIHLGPHESCRTGVDKSTTVAILTELVRSGEQICECIRNANTAWAPRLSPAVAAQLSWLHEFDTNTTAYSRRMGPVLYDLLTRPADSENDGVNQRVAAVWGTAMTACDSILKHDSGHRVVVGRLLRDGVETYRRNHRHGTAPAGEYGSNETLTFPEFVDEGAEAAIGAYSEPAVWARIPRVPDSGSVDDRHLMLLRTARPFDDGWLATPEAILVKVPAAAAVSLKIESTWVLGPDHGYTAEEVHAAHRVSGGSATSLRSLIVALRAADL